MPRKATRNHPARRVDVNGGHSAVIMPAKRPSDAVGEVGDSYQPGPPEALLAPPDDLGEELAEEYLISATSGEQAAEDIRNQEIPEEQGGPFVETTAAQEIDYDDDEPEDSEAEPFPTATSTEEEED